MESKGLEYGLPEGYDEYIKELYERDQEDV